MMDNPGCFALMLGAGSQANCTSSVISLEEVVIVPSRWRRTARVSGGASLLRNSAKSSYVWAHGAPSYAPKGRPALMKSISMSMCSPETIRKKGNEATAAATSAPESSESSRSSAGYVAQDVRGAPRGRKSGAGLGATNPR